MCAFKDVAFKNPAFSPTYRTSFALSLSSHWLTLVIVSFVPIFDLLSDVSFSILFLLLEPLNFAIPVEIAIACRSAAVMISCDVSPSHILARKRPPLCQKYLIREQQRLSFCTERTSLCPACPDQVPRSSHPLC